jgi:cyclopropane fatty-acyl-phospholipid synthase-like methyltransferase
MGAEIEYHQAMITLLELIWGEGYMAPGGPAKVDELVAGLELRGKDVLDIGSGLGGPACHLAAAHGARLTGIDIEPQLVDIANRRARDQGLASRARFVLVEPGPLPFEDRSFDLVLSSGALTQIADKAGLLAEALRVLRPGGAMRNFEWTKATEQLTEELLYFFKMEGLTYALETPASYARLLGEAGFTDIATRDDTPWYRRGVREEYERMQGELHPRMTELLGRADADHFVEDWRSMVTVFENGQLTQTVCHARKPAAAH